ncbi:MAG: glycine zipper domain-containing protein [Reyranellales bacterium]
MFAKSLLSFLLPLALAASLGACNETSGAVQPGVINTSAPGAPEGYRGESGRVVSISQVQIGGNSGISDGTLVGGGVGMASGAAIGAATSNSVGGAVVGGLLGAVGGAIVGNAIDPNSGRRGIAVTIQKDDGSQVSIAQSDDGSLSVGDRAMIVYNSRGVARAIRDNR